MVRLLRGTQISALSLGLLSVLLTAPASAQSILESVQVHGFGGWAYGQTDDLVYGVGTPDGSYDNAEFALNISASPHERLTIVAQIKVESRLGEDEVDLDYAFAEWFVSDALRARIGRVKHPFGIYGEIVDVGTLRPLQLLPQSIYGPTGFTAKAYNGLGVTGNFDWESGWGLQYDVYGGGIEGDFEIPGLITTVPELFLEPNIALGFEVTDTIGGRFIFSTPVNGLTFGVSGWRGDEVVQLEIVEPETRDVYLGHVEFLNDAWTIRSEYGKMKNGEQFEVTSGYLEVAYFLNQHWQLAARWEDYELALPSSNLGTLPPFFPQLLEHQDLAIGVNYWFSRNFVVRLNYHQVEGNRNAFVESPAQVMEVLLTNELDNDTGLFLLGAHFSF